LGHEALLGFHAAGRAAAHAFKELGHMSAPTEEVIDLLDGSAGAEGDALAAAAVS